MRESLQQIDTVDGQSHLFTYTSFVNASSPKEIEKYLGGNLDEATKRMIRRKILKLSIWFETKSSRNNRTRFVRLLTTKCENWAFI